MSKEDVEVIRDQFAVTNERDFTRAMGHYADDVVLIVAPDASGGRSGAQRTSRARCVSVQREPGLPLVRG